MHTSHLRTIVGIGELLWDMLPGGRELGGAPGNFAYWSHVLGSRAVVASRIGADELGGEVRQLLLSRGITDQYLQVDPLNPTSTVRVQVDGSGQPEFEIVYPVAWDFFEWTAPWKILAESADVVCFGTLAQRSAPSGETILQFVDATRKEASRVFDVNLRQSFYSAEVIAEGAKRADVIKLNHQEVPKVRMLLGMPEEDSFSFCKRMAECFDLDLICVTRGANGSLLSDGDKAHEHPGFQVEVKDTVGSGDAFTAALVDAYLNGRSLAETNDVANRLGAWVASKAGATPLVPEGGLMKALSGLQPR